MNHRTLTTLFCAASLALIAPPLGYCQWTQPMPQQAPGQMPQQMPQLSPGPLDGMWMANNGISAMFRSNFYVLAANGQAMEGGTFVISGNEMITQVMQGQGAGQQMRYNYTPGADGKSFTLTMQNGSGSITYQRTGELPPMPQQMPQQQYPQQPMPQQPYPQQQMPQQQYPQQQMPQQQYPQQMPQQQYPQQMPQQAPQQQPPPGQQFPQMQQMPQMPQGQQTPPGQDDGQAVAGVNSGSAQQREIGKSRNEAQAKAEESWTDATGKTWTASPQAPAAEEK